MNLNIESIEEVINPAEELTPRHSIADNHNQNIIFERNDSSFRNSSNYDFDEDFDTTELSVDEREPIETKTIQQIRI